MCRLLQLFLVRDAEVNLLVLFLHMYKYIYYIHVYSSVRQHTVNREEQTEYGVCTYVVRQITGCWLNSLTPSGMCCHIVILGKFLFRNVLLLPTSHLAV